jgi:general secretion pathway protein K
MTDLRAEPLVRRSEQGGVLVATLLIILMLIVLVNSMSAFVVNKYTVLAIDDDAVELEALTLSGLESGVFKVLTTPPELAVTGSQIIHLAAGEISLTWIGETARINLNLATRDWIADVIKSVASPSDNPDAIADELEQRRIATGMSEANAPSLSGRSGPLAHPSELLSLPGMTDRLFARLEPLVTLYTASATIDPRLASEALLATLPGMTEPRLRELLDLRLRDDADMTRILEESGEARQFLDFAKGVTFRFRVEASLKNGTQLKTEIVAALYPDDTEPYRVLYWSDTHSKISKTTAKGKNT